MIRTARSAAAFGLIALLPILKVGLLGAVNSEEEQELYIRLYFLIQFLVPTVDFGYYWGKVRVQLERDREKSLIFDGFSGVGLACAAILLFFDVNLALVFFLSSVLAWNNYQLQILRIEGRQDGFYFIRLGKTTFDLLLIACLFLSDSVAVNYVIAGEIAAVLLTNLSYRILRKELFRPVIFWPSAVVPRDFLFVLIKSCRANFLRIAIPLLYFGDGTERVFFGVLVYELAAQFVLIEWLKTLLDGRVRIALLLTLLIVTLPIQYGLWFLMDGFLAWHLSPAELICLLTGGFARMLSVYTLKAVQQGGVRSIMNLNLSIIVVALLLVLLPQMNPEYALSSLFVMQTFFIFEVAIGLYLVIRFHRSNEKLSI